MSRVHLCIYAGRGMLPRSKCFESSATRKVVILAGMPVSSAMDGNLRLLRC